jgi:sulfur-oxidizing protein SoxB
MVRVGGMSYALEPRQKIGARISQLRLKGRPIEAGRRYKVAGWAPVAEGAGGEPVWEVISRFLRSRKTVPAMRANLPRLIGVQGDPGISP